MKTLLGLSLLVSLLRHRSSLSLKFMLVMRRMVFFNDILMFYIHLLQVVSVALDKGENPPLVKLVFMVKKAQGTRSNKVIVC